MRHITSVNSRDQLADLLVTHNRLEEWDFFRMRLPLMADCGELDEALRLARAHAERDTWCAARSISDPPAEAGRPEEAAAVLEQHPTSNRPSARNASWTSTASTTP